MPPNPPPYAAYSAAMQRVGQHPVVVETSVVEGCVLIGALQLALRHPTFPATSRGILERFIAGFTAQVGTLDPTIAQILALGNAPADDVPHTPEDI